MRKLLFLISFLLANAFLFAQSGTVTGTLLDAEGNPIPGVTIMVKGTKVATVTDLDGNYSIDCNVGETLVFSFIGMKTQQQQVTADMFTSTFEKPIKRPKPVVKKPVQIIQNKAYAEKLSREKLNQSGHFDMYSAPFRWQLSRNKNYNYFYGNRFLRIDESDSIFSFVSTPEPFRWEVEIGAYFSSKTVQSLPKLQTQYAQGRPYLGENTWFGAETNELFAFGPKIENLVFDGSDYAYNENGRLIPKNSSRSLSAKAYNPYDIFKPAFVFRNSVNLRFMRNNCFFLLNYNNRHENGFFEGTSLKNNNLKAVYEQKRNSYKFKLAAEINTLNNKLINTNALWTKTMREIMLTPPTFDNAQGFTTADSELRSSAPETRLNPYFLLNTSLNDVENRYLNVFFDNSYQFDGLTAFLSLKYEKNTSKENFAEPKLLTNTDNIYRHIETIDTENFLTKGGIKINWYRELNFESRAVLISEKLNFDRVTSSSVNFDNKLNRNTLNWTQNLTYRPDYIQGFFITASNTSYFDASKNKLFLPSLGISENFADLFYSSVLTYLKLYTNFTFAVVEQPLYFSDKSYETIPYTIDNLNTFVENRELFYNNKLELETRKSISVGLDAYFFNSKLLFETQYENTLSENSIFPVYTANDFKLQNVASILKHNFEASLKYRLGYNYNFFSWISELQFSKFVATVEELYGNETQIPIAGFQSVSKNLIENQEVGVIVGSAYKRNENDEMIIGTDGFPLVSEEKQIIANPNPDFTMTFENTITHKGLLSLYILLEWQKGGQIWNGTKNILNYYGLSELSAAERNITDYIFEGVTENGETNSTPVDFANPANGLEENRWFRYGETGVAEDGIEKADFLRISELSLYIKPIRNSRQVVRNLNIKLYVKNLLTLTNYTGASPDVFFNNYIQGQGLDIFNLPETRELGLGFSIKF